MAWYYAVAERDHDIQNPTSPEKIRLMGEWLRLGPEKRVLDIACGKCGPALVLASAFGCRITGVERYPGFVATARERVADSWPRRVDRGRRVRRARVSAGARVLGRSALPRGDVRLGRPRRHAVRARAGRPGRGPRRRRRAVLAPQPAGGHGRHGLRLAVRDRGQGRAARRDADRADQLLDRRLGPLRVAPLARGRGLARRERRRRDPARPTRSTSGSTWPGGTRSAGRCSSRGSRARRRGRARAPRGAPGTPPTRGATS